MPRKAVVGQEVATFDNGERVGLFSPIRGELRPLQIMVGHRGAEGVPV